MTDNNTCVICGEIIPEGSQICINCYKQFVDDIDSNEIYKYFNFKNKKGEENDKRTKITGKRNQISKNS